MLKSSTSSIVIVVIDMVSGLTLCVCHSLSQTVSRISTPSTLRSPGEISSCVYSRAINKDILRIRHMTQPIDELITDLQ